MSGWWLAVREWLALHHKRTAKRLPLWQPCSLWLALIVTYQ